MTVWSAALSALAATAMASTSVVDAEVIEYTMNVEPTLNLSPDCYKDREMTVVNGVYPAPPIVADEGDTIRITLNNHHPTDGTAIHYHGVHQRDTPYMDGPAKITQCPLPPQQTQIAEFTADPSGTHYMHAHNSLQRADGVAGVIIVRESSEELAEAGIAYDDEKLLFLTDWYHAPASRQRTGLDSEPFRWIGNPQAFLINGLGLYAGCAPGGEAEASGNCVADCRGGSYYDVTEVEEGMTYRVRIVNGNQLFAMNIAFGGHNVTVIEADGTLVKPFEVSNLDITPGQRYSVLLTADKAVGNYWIRTTPRARNHNIVGLGVLRYKGAEASMPEIEPEEDEVLATQPEIDDLEAGPALDAMLRTLDVEKHAEADALKATPAKTYVMVGTQNRITTGSNQLRWAMNNVTTVYPSVPLITTAHDAAVTADAWPTPIPGTIEMPEMPPFTWNYTESVHDEGGPGVDVENYGRTAVMSLVKGDVVDIVLQNSRALNGAPEMHPWHLHGYSFWVIGQGAGTFDIDTDPANFNLIDPVLRDSVTLWPLGWTAIRVKADNPGAWMWHCHLPAHIVMGMGMTLIVSPDELDAPPPASLSCTQNGLQAPAVSEGETEIDFGEITEILEGVIEGCETEFGAVTLCLGQNAKGCAECLTAAEEDLSGDACEAAGKAICKLEGCCADCATQFTAFATCVGNRAEAQSEEKGCKIECKKDDDTSGGSEAATLAFSTVVAGLGLLAI